MLTIKVPKGNTVDKLFCMNLEARNLEILPRKPPVPIINKVRIISQFSVIFSKIANVSI